MGGFRRFDAVVEACAAEWRKVASTGLDWVPISLPGTALGTMAGYFVQHGELVGFAKPSRGPNAANPVPVAAHEKIAADFAYDLHLPVPPVDLWDRATRKGNLYQYCAVSLVPFQPLDKWETLLRVPAAADRLLPELAFAASAMLAFDTWIDNLDRINSGNLLAGEDPDHGTARYAYIDHANSLTYGWGDGPPARIARRVGPYPDQVTPDGRTIGETIAAIEALSDDHIAQVVDRIPEAFISPPRKACMRAGLCRRRHDLRGVLLGLTASSQ